MTRKHKAIFFSPGTFVCEQTSRDIDSWDTVAAVALGADIVERHGAKPFGFQFATYLIADPIADGEGGLLQVEPREVERTGTYYLGGEVLKYDDIPSTDDTRILLGNMKGNRYPLVIENRNSYRFTTFFNAKDFVVDSTGRIIRSGMDADLVAYRDDKLSQWREADLLQPTT